MNLERVKTFYFVAKYRSFTKAAAALNITQPPLTIAVKLLEQEVQAKLFHRSSRGVMLTPEGEKLFEFSKKVIEEAEITKKLIKDNAGDPQGELKIISTPYLASSWLPKFFADFFKKYPQLKISIIGSLGNIDVNHADIAIRTFIPHHPHIIQKRLYSFHSKLWASANYLQEYGTPKTPEDLDKHRLICFRDFETDYENYGSTRWILNVGSHQRAREPYITINSLEGLINLASRGLGIIEIPGEYVQVKQVGLIQILPQLESPIIDVFFSYSKLIKESSRIQAFEKYVEKIF